MVKIIIYIILDFTSILFFRYLIRIIRVDIMRRVHAIQLCWML